MDNNNKNNSKVKTIIIAVIAAIVVISVVKNVKYRMGGNSISTAADESLNNLKENAEEVGFEEARKKIEEKNIASFAKMEGNQKVLAAAAGILAMEYRYVEGYAQYCKDFGVELPKFKAHSIESNKDIHAKALKALEKMGMSESDVSAQIINPLQAQFKQVIDVEITSISKQDGRSPEQICKDLEATAEENEAVDVAKQRPDIAGVVASF